MSQCEEQRRRGPTTVSITFAVVEDMMMGILIVLWLFLMPSMLVWLLIQLLL